MDVRFYEVGLETGLDLLWMLVLAAVVGLLGALLAELLVGRGKAKETGLFELPRRRGRYVDAGSLVAIPSGAFAAIIAAYLFAPTREVTEGDPPTTTTKYDVLRLIVVAAIGGLSSAAFIASLQEKFTALLTADRLREALGTASTALDQIEQAAAQRPADLAAAAAANSLETEIQAKATLAKARIQQALTDDAA
jgi:hypothetical protein